MGAQAMAWAVRQRAGSATAKLVLLLADNCDPRGKVQCSFGHLAQRAEVSTGTVGRAVTQLVDAGLLERLSAPNPPAGGHRFWLPYDLGGGS